MKTFIRKYLPLLCGAVCLLALLGVYIGIYSRRNAGTYRLSTLEGDAAALAPFTIRMEQQDGVHTQSITLDGGTLRHQYRRTPLQNSSMASTLNARQLMQAYPQAALRAEDEMQQLPQDFMEEQAGIESHFYSTDTLQTVLEVQTTEQTGQFLNRTTYMEEYCNIFTDVMVQDVAQPFYLQYIRNTGSGMNPYLQLAGWASDSGAYRALQEETAAHVVQLEDGGTFVFPRVFPFCSGEAALYRINEWEPRLSELPLQTLPDGWKYYPESPPQGSATAIATLPLDEQELLTLELTAVGDRLALLYIRQGALMLRIYAQSGALLAEEALGSLALPQGRYLCRVSLQQEGEDTVLCYMLQDYAYSVETGEGRYGTARHYAALLQGNTLRLLSHCETPASISVLGEAYLGDTWVIIGTAGNDAGSNLRAYRPEVGTNTILVLDERGSTLYRGALHTDAGEDQIQYIMMDTQFAEFSSKTPFSYSRYMTVPAGGIRRR